MIYIKPLSVNQAYRSGPRYKTKEYLKYIEDVTKQLPNIKVPEGKLELRIVAGLSNRGADVDNIAKPFIDILQKRYDFNDNRIYKLTLIKDIVKKGDEYIMFDVSNITES